MSKQIQIDAIQKELESLTNSPLYPYRIENGYQPVIGEGSFDALVVFVGEAPGKKEGITGKPFCGASGKVLDQLLMEASLTREEVYITSIVNDRPPQNRDPKPAEIALYSPFLIRQLEIIQPKVIATLGRFSMEFLMNKFGLENEVQTISHIHGKKFKIHTSWGEVYILPLFHPAVALYTRSKFDEMKADFKKLKKIL